MPNLLDANGLQTATRTELIAFYTAKYQTIYGPDINLNSDSPDGQMMNIYVQSALDYQDLLVQVNNMFDPDNAIGVILDQRVTINGVQRQTGTYTITNISLVTNQSVNLYGLDQSDQVVYTVSDNAGTLWNLEHSQVGIPMGFYVLSFRAASPGAQLTTPNTITVPVTVVLGVTSVNNPTLYTTLGINEETDAELKIRRQKSVSLASQGYLEGLLAALENISGISSAFVYENNTSATNIDGVPGHSIWVIVSGTGTSADIAQAIYTKRNAGCGMFGSTTYTVTQIDGSPFVLRWDSVVTQNVFMSFNAASINGTTAPNIAAIRNGLVASFIPGVNQEVNINTLGTLVQKLDANTLVTGAGFSLGIVQTLNLSAVAASGTFQIAYNGNNSVAINWNDSAGTIQTKISVMANLSMVVVTGSIAGKSLVFNLASVNGGVVGLITAVNDFLYTSAPALVKFSYNENYVNVLAPSSKKNQMIVSAANIIILPMILNPVSTTIRPATSQTYAALGGYGSYFYSFLVNNSGGTLDNFSGLYVSGAITGVVDTISVVDTMGNTATATVTVI